MNWLYGVLGAGVAIPAALNIATHIMTRPREEGAPNAIPVGAMLHSEKYDHAQYRDKKVMHSPIVRLMQVLWINTEKVDAKNHSTQTPPEHIHEVTNIPYINDGSIYHLLDVYYPEGAQGKLPVIIDVHGGGWMYGDKELNKLYCLALASRGYVVFNMSYALAPDVAVDRQLGDVMKALHYIGEHIGEYPCDTDRILLTGDSAGGMLAAYASVLTQSDELCRVFAAPRPALKYAGLLLTSAVPSMDQGGYMALYMKRLWGSDRKTKETARFMNIGSILPYGKPPRTYMITSAGDILGHDQTVDACKKFTAAGVECKLMDFGGPEGKKLPHVFTVINPYNEIGKKTIDDALDWFALK